MLMTQRQARKSACGHAGRSPHNAASWSNAAARSGGSTNPRAPRPPAGRTRGSPTSPPRRSSWTGTRSSLHCFLPRGRAAWPGPASTPGGRLLVPGHRVKELPHLLLDDGVIGVELRSPENRSLDGTVRMLLVARQQLRGLLPDRPDHPRLLGPVRHEDVVAFLRVLPQIEEPGCLSGIPRCAPPAFPGVPHRLPLADPDRAGEFLGLD